MLMYRWLIFPSEPKSSAAAHRTGIPKRVGLVADETVVPLCHSRVGPLMSVCQTHLVRCAGNGFTNVFSTFGGYLQHVRKRAGMTQHDLAAATGYSRSLISALERNARLPDIDALSQTFIPVLGLQDEPHIASQLVVLAALARGERPPVNHPPTHWHRAVIASGTEDRNYRLPMPPTEILGREREIYQLCQRMLGHHGRLLTLVGPPGVGKTRLVQAVGSALQTTYKDGACFVALAAVSEASLVAVALLDALRIPHGASKPPEIQLIESLRRKEVLLILDNFEQIPDAAPLVADLLSECGGVHLLVTSRERLHLRAEQRYLVPPLELDAAVELFVRRASSMDDSFALAPANRPLVEEICQRLDRLPLAIELCAAQTDLLSLSQLLVGLNEHRLPLLTVGAADSPPQHRTLRSAIHHSYFLLSDGERKLFRYLGIFSGGFDLYNLESVIGWHIEQEQAGLSATLHALIGKSLVYPQTLPSGGRRYLLLETIREFALEQLRAHDEEASLRQRHTATYLQLFRSADSEIRGPQYLAWLERLEPERDNLRAALQWEINEGHYSEAVWLLLAASFYWAVTGHGNEEARWLAQVLPFRHTLTNELRLGLTLTFYRAAYLLEEFQPVAHYMEEIMPLLEDCPYKLLRAIALSFHMWDTADVAQAAAYLEQAIALTMSAGEPPVLSEEFGALADRNFILTTLYLGYAALLCDQGEFAKATSYAIESIRLFQARGNRTGFGEACGLLGRLALLQADIRQAQWLLQQAVAIAMSLNYPAMRYECQALLGVTYLYSGDAAEARRLLMESLRRCREQRNTSLVARVCTLLADTALWEEETEEAELWFAESLAYDAPPRSFTVFQVEQAFVAARLATARHDYARAATLFGLADQISSKLNYTYAGPMRAQIDVALTSVRAAMEPADFATAMSIGQQRSPEESFATILVSYDPLSLS